MFHENGDDDIDEHKLGDEDEDDKVDGRDEWVHTAVVAAVVRTIAVVAQRVLKTNDTPLLIGANCTTLIARHSAVFHLHDLRHRYKAVVTTTIQRSFDGLSKVIQCM